MQSKAIVSVRKKKIHCGLLHGSLRSGLVASVTIFVLVALKDVLSVAPCSPLARAFWVPAHRAGGPRSLLGMAGSRLGRPRGAWMAARGEQSGAIRRCADLETSDQSGNLFRSCRKEGQAASGLGKLPLRTQERFCTWGGSRWFRSLRGKALGRPDSTPSSLQRSLSGCPALLSLWR